MADEERLSFRIDVLGNGKVVIRDIRKEITETGTAAEQMAKKADGAFTRLQSNITGIGSRLAAAFSVTAIASFVSGIFRAADAVSDLSDISGLSISTILGLEQITAKYGVTAQEAAGGVRFLQRSLIESISDATKANDPLRRLGFTTAELLRLSADPDGFLVAFAEKLGAIENPTLRMHLAMEAAARAGGRLGPMFLDIAQNGLPKVSSETVQAYKALGEFADTAAVATVKISQFTTTALAPLIESISSLPGRIRAARTDLVEWLRLAADATAFMMRVPTVRLPAPQDATAGIEAVRAANATERAKAANAAAMMTQMSKTATVDQAKKAMDGLIESLEKQSIGLEAERIKLTQGEEAARRFAFAQELVAFKARLANDGLKIPAGLDVAYAKLTEKIMTQVTALQEAAAAAKTYSENQALAKEALSLREQLKNDAQRLEADLTADIGGEMSRRILDARMEAAERMKSVKQLVDFAIITEEQGALRRAQIQQAAREKADPFSGLNRRIQSIDIEAQVLGPGFDTLRPKIEAVEDSLRDLIKTRQEAASLAASGFIVDPARLAAITNGIDVLTQKLDQMRQVQKVKEAIEGMADGIANAFDRALQSTGSILDRLKGFVKDSIDSIDRELTKLLVTDPLKEWLKKQLGGILGIPTVTAPGGAAGAGQEAAIQAMQVTATTAIQAQATTATAGMQAEQSVATVAIESTQTVAVTAIETVQASAIAAIQAAGAASGGSNGAGAPGLFGLLFGGDQPPGLNPAQIAANEYHTGGTIGTGYHPTRMLPASLIRNAPRYHTGGDVGRPPLKPGEVPLVARVGERISTEEQWNAATSGKGGKSVTLNMNFNQRVNETYWSRSQGSIMKDLARAIEKHSS